MMKLQHKIAVLKYIKGNIWLLIIPLLRGLFSLKVDFYHWLKMAYVDIIFILLVLGSAWLRWRFVKFEIREKGIYVKKGVAFQREFILPYSAISCAIFHCPFLLRPFRAVKIFLETESCSGMKKHKNADATLIVSETDYTQIYQIIPNKLSDNKTTYRASRKEIILFSMFFSSTIPGLVYLGTFFIQSSRIVGEKIKLQFFSVVNELTETVEKFTEDVTAIAVVVVIIIAVGWSMSFVIKAARHFHYKICKCGKSIYIENGYFYNWKYYVNYSRINAVDMRQNLLMKIAKIMSVHINCAGYGKRKNELAVFVPMTTKKRAMKIMEELLPNFTPSNNLLRTKKSYIIAYIWLPLILIVGVVIATVVMCRVAYEWNNAVRFIGVMFEVPLIYFLAVRLMAKISTGIGVSDKAVTVSYCRATQFHTVIVPKEQIAYIKIHRTFLQCASGCCDVTVYTRGERVIGHRVRGIVFAEAIWLVENYDKMR